MALAVTCVNCGPNMATRIKRSTTPRSRPCARSGPAQPWQIPQGAQIEYAAAGLRQLRLALELVAMGSKAAGVAVVIPTFNEVELRTLFSAVP